MDKIDKKCEEIMLPNKVPFEPLPENKKPLTNRLNYIKRNIIPAIIKQNISWPFRKPVDFEGLKLYDYPNIIKQPMDLSTISKRLNHGWYESSSDLISDFDLIIKNCLTYNRPFEDVSQMADSLNKFFYEKLKKMPAEENVVSDNKKKEKDRQVAVKRSKFGLSLQKRCFRIICEILDPKYAEFAEPFYHPVDTARFVDYPNLISEPMDLSHVKRNVETLKYQSFMDFAFDMKLIFNNCYIYNVAGSEIFTQAQRLQSLYQEIISETCQHYRSEENIAFLIKVIEDKIKILEDEISNSPNIRTPEMIKNNYEGEYTYEDKRRISGMVSTKLPGDELVNILKICNGDSINSSSSDEVVIDFDKLKNITLYNIEKYVDDYVNTNKRVQTDDYVQLVDDELDVSVKKETAPKKQKVRDPIVNKTPNNHLSDESSESYFECDSDNMMGLG